MLIRPSYSISLDLTRFDTFRQFSTCGRRAAAQPGRGRNPISGGNGGGTIRPEAGRPLARLSRRRFPPPEWRRRPIHLGAARQGGGRGTRRRKAHKVRTRAEADRADRRPTAGGPGHRRPGPDIVHRFTPARPPSFGGRAVEMARPMAGRAGGKPPPPPRASGEEPEQVRRRNCAAALGGWPAERQAVETNRQTGGGTRRAGEPPGARTEWPLAYRWTFRRWSLRRNTGPRTGGTLHHSPSLRGPVRYANLATASPCRPGRYGVSGGPYRRTRTTAGGECAGGLSGCSRPTLQAVGLLQASPVPAGPLRPG